MLYVSCSYFDVTTNVYFTIGYKLGSKINIASSGNDTASNIIDNNLLLGTTYLTNDNSITSSNTTLNLISYNIYYYHINVQK